MQLTLELIDNAIKPGNSNFHLKPESEEAKIVNEATKKGYLIRLSHTQIQWSEEGLKRAQKELTSDAKKAALVDLAQNHVIKLIALSITPLSTQLQRITGDTFNSVDFVNKNDDDLNAAAGNVIQHIKTGLKFLIPNL